MWCHLQGRVTGTTTAPPHPPSRHFDSTGHCGSTWAPQACNPHRRWAGGVLPPSPSQVTCGEEGPSPLLLHAWGALLLPHQLPNRSSAPAWGSLLPRQQPWLLHRHAGVPAGSLQQAPFAACAADRAAGELTLAGHPVGAWPDRGGARRLPAGGQGKGTGSTGVRRLLGIVWRPGCARVGLLDCLGRRGPVQQHGTLSERASFDDLALGHAATPPAATQGHWTAICSMVVQPDALQL